jgi:hypothetical protein
MEMPKPTAAHKKLEKLVGTWVGEEKMHPSPWAPKGGIATGHIENRSALDGFVVIQDYVQERDGQVTFRGHGVFTWDAPRESYVLTWWDSMGMPPNEFRGTFEGDSFILTAQNPMGSNRTTFDFSGEGTYSFKMEISQDGEKWMTFMEGSYTRK